MFLNSIVIAVAVAAHLLIFTTARATSTLENGASVCPPTDDDGSPLITGQSNSATGVCVYPNAGSCTYFPGNGSFSSGSSKCPDGLQGGAAPEPTSPPNRGQGKPNKWEGSTRPVDHKIVVGIDGKLKYGPENIRAAVGDTVTFEFKPKNHTVTQSSFNQPCRPLFNSTGKVGFESGFRFVKPNFKIKINDTAPIWGYCGQTAHCGKGMVFAINTVENGPNSFAAFKVLAVKINGTATADPVNNGQNAPNLFGLVCPATEDGQIW